MKQYLDLLRDIKENGVTKTDRTGTGTKSVFGRQVRYDLADGFPAVTTKKLYFNSVVHELLWFLKGTGNIEYLAQHVHIWMSGRSKRISKKTICRFRSKFRQLEGADERVYQPNRDRSRIAEVG